MKGMPGLYYAEGVGDRPRWVGSVLYMDSETAEVRQRYLQEDAEPPAPEASDGAPTLLAVAALVGALAVGSFTAVNLFPAQATLAPVARAVDTAWSGPWGVERAHGGP